MSPINITDKYSNIKIVFLPANTTSKLQPLDLGIIMNFKTYYRKLFMRYVLTKFEECSNATDVVKSMNILQAIRWIAEAWKSVDKSVIQKCFRKASILDKDFNVVQDDALENDPFIDLDCSEKEEDDDLLDLMKQTNGDDHCSQHTYTCDDGITTYLDMDNDH